VEDKKGIEKAKVLVFKGVENKVFLQIIELKKGKKMV